jgi:hypothetical protein
MNIKTIAITVLTAALVATAAYHIHTEHQRLEQWEQDRVVKTIRVSRGDTLDKYGYQYKPAWMDVRDYRGYIIDLNDLYGADIYAGDTIDVYVIPEHYTNLGIMYDNTITTTNGHEWVYYADYEGYVEVTFSDNGTDKVEDDIIINVSQIND